MDTGYVATVSIMALLIAISVGYLIYHLRVNVLNAAGKGAEKKTAAVLRKFGVIRGFKVLSGIDLNVDGKTAHIENMLIGYFGVLLVHTCGQRGEFYGTLEGGQWTITDGDSEGVTTKKTTIPNPLLEQQRAMGMLRTLFSRAEIYNVPIENVVFFTSKSKKTRLFITHSGEILLPGKLAPYLNKTRFEKDAGLDVGKLADVVNRNNQAAT